MCASRHRRVAIGAGEFSQHLGEADEFFFHQVERIAELQHDGGVHDVLGRGAPVAVLAEAVAAGLHDLLHEGQDGISRSEEHTSELQSLMRISYAVFCLKKKKKNCANTICWSKLNLNI